MSINFVNFNAVPSEKCAICLTPLDENVKGHGKHLFHDECIQQWIKIQSVCPICKVPVEAKSVLGEQTYSKWKVGVGFACVLIVAQIAGLIFALNKNDDPVKASLAPFFGIAFVGFEIGMLFAFTQEIPEF